MGRFWSFFEFLSCYWDNCDESHHTQILGMLSLFFLSLIFKNFILYWFRCIMWHRVCFLLLLLFFRNSLCTFCNRCSLFIRMWVCIGNIGFQKVVCLHFGFRFIMIFWLTHLFLNHSLFKGKVCFFSFSSSSEDFQALS